jgi:antitoxin (DNA-binding transcriptional repressor) of toxin-antitoxin stability system
MRSDTLLSKQIVSLKEFRLDTEKYINALKEGASFVVMKRSKPVFRLEPVDDEWETVVDFREIRKGGVPAREILKALKNLNKKK